MEELWTSNSESAWRSKIGMSSKDDRRPPKERNVYLRRLKGLVEQRMLHFIHDVDKDPLAQAERAPTWTPIPWICHNLEISHAHLSRLFRELLGMNVIQFYDTLKAKEMRIALKYIALIQAFVTASRGTGFQPVNPGHAIMGKDAHATIPAYSGNGSAQFWKWLKEQYRNPDFDRAALAREFDFPNASRFHRAFYYATNSTPREFENTIIRLALTDPAALEQTIALYASLLVGDDACLRRDVQFVRLKTKSEQTEETAPVELEYPIVLYKEPNDTVTLLRRAVATLVQGYLQRIHKHTARTPLQAE